MRVSIIMALYNGASIIGGAIEDIQKQSFSDWELLIVDDGSADNGAQIVEQYCIQDPRIILLRNQSNRGLAYSLNLAWRAAKGDLIARADPDDLNHPRRLEIQESVFSKDPDLDVLGSAALLVSSSGESLAIARRPCQHEQLVKLMYRQTPFYHPSVMMRRSFLERSGGYDQSIRFGQDSDLWLRTYRDFKFQNLDQVLLRYTIRDKVSLERTLWAVWVILKNSWREGLILSKGWYAARLLLANSLIALRIRKSHTFSDTKSLDANELRVYSWPITIDDPLKS
jgi:glycosyltransferase EpsE